MHQSKFTRTGACIARCCGHALGPGRGRTPWEQERSTQYSPPHRASISLLPQPWTTAFPWAHPHSFPTRSHFTPDAAYNDEKAAVISYLCVRSIGFAHELGHTFGVHHNREAEQAEDSASYAYAPWWVLGGLSGCITARSLVGSSSVYVKDIALLGRSKAAVLLRAAGPSRALQGELMGCSNVVSTLGRLMVRVLGTP